MSGQAADGGEVLTSLGLGGGEPATPEADKFLEQAVKEMDGGKTDKPGEQSPEAVKPADDAKKPDEQQPKEEEKKPAEEANKPDEGETDFDKIENPTPENWRKAREALKAERQKVKEMAEKKPAPEAKEPSRETVPEPKAKSDIPPDLVFETLSKVVSGEETKYRRADVEKFIQANLTPVQVKGVIEAAAAGRYGEASEEIGALAREQLPMVIAAGEENRTREAAFDKLRSERETATRELLEAFPEVKGNDANNPVYKELDTAARELEAVIPHFQQIPSAPRLVKQFVELRREAAKAQAAAVENAALKAENERLAKLVGRPATPPAGGGGTDKQGEQNADAWLAEQAAAGKLRVE